MRMSVQRHAVVVVYVCSSTCLRIQDSFASVIARQYRNADEYEDEYPGEDADADDPVFGT